ncbi:helix-turn-helix domain-containing protein [Halomonas binhaiensis]|uniref:Helix-turn-helix domain-containing protein n=1 Tax=Halomonas binhaiensis TaxID=2562282 RepID=A0A5C1NI57_9GAMM|nr:helix-turn-helix domain-containing protein [Halomonas binhaiensis]QEM81927.1 helix-turn-helix domain-containing protein [Halomonas binhaiensis]
MTLFSLPYDYPRCVMNCRTCGRRSLCLPMALDEHEIAQFDSIVQRRITMSKDGVLVHQKESFSCVFAVRSGSFKQVIKQGERDSQAQLSHFYLPGELMGLDGMGEGYYPGTIIALESSIACEISYAALEALSEHLPSLCTQLYQRLSTELRDNRQTVFLLPNMKPDQRVALFLTHLLQRFQRQGSSPYHLHLSMTRIDIGNYLGMTAETVSHILSRFQRLKVLSVSGRVIYIQDQKALLQLAERPDRRQDVEAQ